MGKGILYCDLCRARILESDFEKGSAVTVLNRSYCAGCRDTVIREASVEEVPDPPPSGKKSSAVWKAIRTESSSRASKMNSTGHIRSIQAGRAARRVPAKGSPGPLLVAGVIVGIVILILAFVLSRKP